MSPSSGNVKLRHSCNGCTEAKMGCSKEKPACARCLRRREPCIYAPSKRAGRPGRKASAANDSNNRNTTANRPVSAGTSSPTSPTGSINLMTTQALQERGPVLVASPAAAAAAATAGVPGIPGPSSPDILSLPDYTDLLATFTHTPPWSTPETGSENPVTSLGSLSSSSSLGAGAFTFSPFDFDTASGTQNDFNLLGPNNSHTKYTTDHLLFGLDSNTNDPSNNNHPCSCTGSAAVELRASSAAPSIGFPVDRQATELRSPAPARCFTRAVTLLDNLTTANEVWCACAAAHSTAAHQEQFPTFGSVMEQNNASINAVNEILNCTCSDNRYVLHVLSLILFKALEWYAWSTSVPFKHPLQSPANGRTQQAMTPPSTATFPEYELDDHQKERVVCEIVLSKLHKVMRVANRLSDSLLKCESHDHTTPSDPALRLADRPATSTSTPDVLACRMGADLRSRLRDLSHALVETLEKLK